jgi:hypothetical protein
VALAERVEGKASPRTTKLGTKNLNLMVTSTVIVSPLIVNEAVGFGIDAFESVIMPGEDHIVQNTFSLPVRLTQSEGVNPLPAASGLTLFSSVVIPDSTAATLAPCLAAFLIEFFVNHARENSAIPNRIISIKKSTRAVSINV